MVIPNWDTIIFEKPQSRVIINLTYDVEKRADHRSPLDGAERTTELPHNHISQI